MKHEMSEHQEPERDPVIAGALRWAEGEVPLDDVDWGAMRTNIRNRAALPLARRRALEAASPRWVRPLVPIAAAASIAVLLWTGAFDFGGAPAVNVAPVTVTAAAPSIREALLSDVSDQEFRLLMAERNDSEELLLIAASQR